MSLRDEMIAACVPYMHHYQAEEAADAILAKLRPASLVWVQLADNAWDSGCYSINKKRETYRVHVWTGLKHGFHYFPSKETLEEAKAAAEAHHIAAWRKAGGLDT